MKRLLELFRKLLGLKPPVEEREVKKVTIIIESVNQYGGAEKEKVVLDGKLHIPKNSGWRTIGEHTEYHLIVLGNAPSVVHQHQ